MEEYKSIPCFNFAFKQKLGKMLFNSLFLEKQYFFKKAWLSQTVSVLKTNHFERFVKYSITDFVYSHKYYK